MNISPTNSMNFEDCAAFINQLLSHFSDKRERLICLYLLSVADKEGWVNSSLNAMAIQLNMNRKTLIRHINSLCEKGYATWETTPGLRRPNLLHLGKWTALNKEENEATKTMEETSTGTTDGTSPVASKNHETHSLTDRYKETEDLFMTGDWTRDWTTKKEKEKNKEENPPAPPKEENKQEKVKTKHTNARESEKIFNKDITTRCLQKSERTTTLELRRQQFLASLLPYQERYGKEMVTQFGDYWTEPNRSQTKMRFELQRTWSTPLRLATWARNDKLFNQNHNNHDKKHRPTPNELIEEAQRTAIEETERFIREAAIRRGEVPPHFPF